MKTTTNGIRALECVVTDNCREVHGGDTEAFYEAMKKLKYEYDQLCIHWKRGMDVDFHFVLVVERPSDK